MRPELPNFEPLRISVIGDVMMDRYWKGNTSRISPEAPVPVVHVEKTEDRPGGAANVALNLKTLGCQVQLFSLIGEDEAGKILANDLLESNISCFFRAVQNHPTITKLRVLGRNQQLIRLDFETPFPSAEAEILIQNHQSKLFECDAIILSDYNKGVLTNCSEIIKMARRHIIPVIVDPKTNDFDRYRGANIITPNLKEFESIVGHCRNEDEIVVKAKKLLAEFNFDAVLITRGEEGMTLVSSTHIHHLRAHASEVYDVSGAGDTVISVFTAALTSGSGYEKAITLANIAAGIVVRKLGVATVSIPELRRTIQASFGGEVGILKEDDLLTAVADARAHNERIVMTNGCFDVLHPGHISYLEEAKSLGDRLIVAINDDASVQRLKGSARPINSLFDRMKMLSSIRAVDWVVAFSEDTPERIISLVSPDILVKGGDYTVEQIAGAKHVLANGGQVKIIDFVPGYSSTSLINKIKG